MNLLEVTMVGRRGTYGCDAARKKLGGETAVQGAVHGFGEFSPARRSRKGKSAAVAMAHGREFRIWRRLSSLRASAQCSCCLARNIRYEVFDRGVYWRGSERLEKGGQARRLYRRALGHAGGLGVCF